MRKKARNHRQRDSVRREDPITKELRFDQVTKEGNQKNAGTYPREAKKRSMRRTHGRESQQAEKTEKSQSESEGTL